MSCSLSLSLINSVVCLSVCPRLFLSVCRSVCLPVCLCLSSSLSLSVFSHYHVVIYAFQHNGMKKLTREYYSEIEIHYQRKLFQNDYTAIHIYPSLSHFPLSLTLPSTPSLTLPCTLSLTLPCTRSFSNTRI